MKKFAIPLITFLGVSINGCGPAVQETDAKPFDVIGEGSNYVIALVASPGARPRIGKGFCAGQVPTKANCPIIETWKYADEVKEELEKRLLAESRIEQEMLNQAIQIEMQSLAHNDSVAKSLQEQVDQALATMTSIERNFSGAQGWVETWKIHIKRNTKIVTDLQEQITAVEEKLANQGPQSELERMLQDLRREQEPAQREVDLGLSSLAKAEVAVEEFSEKLKTAKNTLKSAQIALKNHIKHRVLDSNTLQGLRKSLQEQQEFTTQQRAAVGTLFQKIADSDLIYRRGGLTNLEEQILAMLMNLI